MTENTEPRDAAARAPQGAAASVLSDDELSIIARFIALVCDEGVRAILTLRIIDEYGNDEAATEALDMALGNLRNTCTRYTRKDHIFQIVPTKVVDAAPALALVVMYLGREPEITTVHFPTDFVPDSALVEKCLDIYFANARIDAVTDCATPEPKSD